MVAADGIDVVSVSVLHERLGFATPLVYPAESGCKALTDWKMEVDDAPILRYLYRHFRPIRHLEFGTWTGIGACYCLEESAASVWTINLPEGEFSYGKPVYTSPDLSPPNGARPTTRIQADDIYQTDAGLFIGRAYRDAGLGHRVCQIYCDSRNWDTSAYPRDFFDSVLIDGGHSEEVVLSDTRKALSVLRSGGLIMWHDFCPDPAVFPTFQSVVGVLQALTANWQDLSRELSDAFWIRPSFLLFGVRR